MDFENTQEAGLAIHAMVNVLDEAAAHEDIPATVEMYDILADATAGVTRLVEKLSKGMGRPSLGSTWPPSHWKDWSPDDILGDLGNLAQVEEDLIKAKQIRVENAGSAERKRLSQEISRYTRTLRNKIRSAKAWIQKYWPDAWTETQDERFKDWL